LRLGGTDVTVEHRIPLVGYTGDTAPPGLDDNPLFFETQILITEMTFVAPSHRKRLIHKCGHMHLDDIVERKERFQNEIVILGHLSTRYSALQVEKMVKRLIPDMLDGRLRLWV
jgi:ribonuclease Z